jgi:hypothetical protein
VNYAAIAHPLTNLLKKNVPFNWSDDCQFAFQSLRDKLLCKPILSLFDPNRQTELHTDASSVGLGAMLIQFDSITKAKHLVYCCSRSLSDAEKKYHSTKLEVLAVIWALDKLRPYLDREFTLVTDCNAIVFLNRNRSSTSQLSRWFDLVQEFHMTVVHNKGTTMSHVDCLSRCPVEPPCDDLDRDVLQLNEGHKELLAMQYSDSVLRTLIDVLRKDPQQRSRSESLSVREYLLEDLLKRVFKNDHGTESAGFVVPNALRKSFVIQSHDLSGHVGTARTVYNLKSRGLYFPCMNR